MFEVALLRMGGLSFDTVVHIGDDYACDIEGAKNVGFRTIWITTKDNADEKDKYPCADAIVTGIADVLPILSKWRLV